MPRFFACAILSFLFISVDKQSEYLVPVRSALSLIVSPLQIVIDVQVQIVESVGSYFKLKNNLISDLKRMRAENLMLSSRAQRYSALRRENSRLRELLASQVASEDKILVAKILAIETQSGSKKVVVDKGSNAGASVGQALADVSGILGQVISVSPFVSEVLLITDPTHALPVVVNRTGLRAVAIGKEVSDMLSLSFIPAGADVSIGDLVVSSGLGGRFPSGYPVGIVVKAITTPGESFMEIALKPVADLSTFREALLIRNEGFQLEND